MIFYLTLPIFSIVLIVLQSTVSDLIFSGNMMLEISLVTVIYAGFRLDLIRGIVLTFVIGFVFDCVSGSLPGLFAFIYMIVFLCSFFASEWLDTEKIHIIILFSFICSLIKDVALSLFYYLAFDISEPLGIFFIFLLQAFVIGFCAPLFFYFMDRMGVFIYEQRV